ncbi:MAG TPA: hypothetical protein VJ975_03935 [Candidatus Limnocylindria bacterium]|nr:hypothetical protein [Candidatus Limnocylindria bacterium]
MSASAHRKLLSMTVAMVVATATVAPALAAEVVLQSGTSGCTGVLPSNDGNTDMRVVGGTMTPGGTAVFEITYPLNAASVGKQFTILDCAFINDVPALKYIVSFVPSNQSFVLQMTLAVPSDAPVGGLYCNYVKTTGSPTAAQASQRKAGPACFVIRAPAGTPTTTTSTPHVTPPAPSTGTTSTTTPGKLPILLPNTAVPAPEATGH